MPTPLYDALRKYAGREPLRFHMPGHKGSIYQPSDLRWMAPIDVTELPGTGNLYEEGEPFDSAQALWAGLFGFDQCQFLTGGSTMASTPDWPCVPDRGTRFSWTGTATARPSTPWLCWI